eukprot:Stramenopile-MAST_4_protein_5380
MWAVSTDRGDRFHAQFVVMNFGTLTQPKLPGVPGVETFRGHMFHTSRWEYDGDQIKAALAKDEVFFDINGDNWANKERAQGGRHSKDMDDYKEKLNSRRWKLREFMNQVVPLWVLRDAICNRVCRDKEDFITHIFTDRGAKYVEMLFTTIARINIINAQSTRDKKDSEKRDGRGKQVASVQHPSMFGEPIFPILKLMHCIHLFLYKSNTGLGARYFVPVGTM